jgi:hypothetical protein
MESFAGFRFFKVAGSVFDFNGLRVLSQANPRYLLLVVLTARDVFVDDENDDAFASSREDEVLLNLREEREPPPPPKPIPVTPLEQEDESVVKLIVVVVIVARDSFERREKEYTFIRSNL